jgi:AcrR family transcriptional regulator
VTRPKASPRRLGRPPSVDSADTRVQILDAARRLFGSRGYDATTNKDIAEAVGITTGAIYHYFASKIDLYAAVYAEVQDVVYTTFEKAALEHDRYVDRLSAVLDAAVAVNQRDPSIASFVVGVAGEVQRHPELAPVTAPYRRRGRSFLAQLVGEAAQGGEFAPGVDPDEVADMTFALLGGLATFSSVSGDVERHRGATTMVQRLLTGSMFASATPVAAPSGGTGEHSGPALSA